jgi:hypothetical protein
LLVGGSGGLICGSNRDRIMKLREMSEREECRKI